MNIVSLPDQVAVLLEQLRWFVRLRWLAGLTVLLGICANGLATKHWTPEHGFIVVVGGVILLYNIGLFLAVRRTTMIQARLATLGVFAWVQILLDLACLTALTNWTGGALSPFMGLFVLHMVFASLMLGSGSAFAAAATAIGMVLLTLWVGRRWPADHTSMLALVGWHVTLIMTVFVTNHITNSLRRRSHELRYQSTRTNAVLSTAADGIITVDAAGQIESLNPAAERAFGCHVGDAVGQALDEFIPDLTFGAGSPIVGAAQEMQARRADGGTFPIEVTVSRTELGDRPLFTCTARDLTEQKRAEAEVAQLNETLRHQQQVLAQHEKMAALGQLAAGIAHEISNPLANMDSLLQIAQRQPDRMRPDTVDVLRQQIERMNQIIDQMRTFAHPDDVETQRMPVCNVIRQALEMVRFDPRLRQVKVIQSREPAVCQVEVMPAGIQQVLINLVFNALDAMEQAVEPTLEIQTTCDGDWAMIEVSDNGSGIEAEHVNRIFEPFFTTKPMGRGTGLGLAISFSIVKRHGGRLEVQSEPGRGSRFKIVLPAVQCPS